MSSDDDAPMGDRVSYLERELKTAQQQITALTENLLGTITILCLPLSVGKRLEIGFKQIKDLPDDILTIIVKRYVQEAKYSDVSFDEMISPLVAILGFERAWKILSRETVKDNYGEWALNKWEEMARNHPCED